MDWDVLNNGTILNINKPIGITSFQVVKGIRSCFNIKKVGHAGTLDPFATGVLLILTGSATKKSRQLTELEKQYKADIEIGVTTNTLDVEGRIISGCQTIDEPDQNNIRRVLNQFIGDIEQIPPIYSAIKRNGKPLYKYARRGLSINPGPRSVHISDIQLLSVNWPIVSIDITCSKGTYIRSLARDIGITLGSCAYLRALTRRRIGSYHIQDALDLDEVLRNGSKCTKNDRS